MNDLRVFEHWGELFDLLDALDWNLTNPYEWADPDEIHIALSFGRFPTRDEHATIRAARDIAARYATRSVLP